MIDEDFDVDASDPIASYKQREERRDYLNFLSYEERDELLGAWEAEALGVEVTQALIWA